MLKKIFILGLLSFALVGSSVSFAASNKEVHPQSDALYNAAKKLQHIVSQLPDELSYLPTGQFDQHQFELIGAALKAGIELYRLDIISPNSRLILSFLKSADNSKFNYYQMDLVSANRSWKQARMYCRQIAEILCSES